MSTTIQPRAVAANAGRAQRAGGREWTALAVLLLPVLLVAVDATVLSFALPSISEALQPSGTQLLWMIDIYSLVLAGLLVSMGSLADRVGRRRLLLIGSVGFAVVSVIAAYAPTASALIAARAALGFFGAMLMPSTLSLLRNIFVDRQQRRLAVAIWAAGFSGGAALGPIVGGFLLEHYWWGSAFLMAVPVLVLLLILAPIFVPESKDPTPGPVDVVSIGLSLVAMTPIVYAIKSIAHEGFTSLSLLLLIVGFAAGHRVRPPPAESPAADAGRPAVCPQLVQRRRAGEPAQRVLAGRVPVLRLAAPAVGAGREPDAGRPDPAARPGRHHRGRARGGAIGPQGHPADRRCRRSADQCGRLRGRVAGRPPGLGGGHRAGVRAAFARHRGGRDDLQRRDHLQRAGEEGRRRVGDLGDRVRAGRGPRHRRAGRHSHRRLQREGGRPGRRQFGRHRHRHRDPRRRNGSRASSCRSRRRRSCWSPPSTRSVPASA